MWFIDLEHAQSLPMLLPITICLYAVRLTATRKTSGDPFPWAASKKFYVLSWSPLVLNCFAGTLNVCLYCAVGPSLNTSTCQYWIALRQIIGERSQVSPHANMAMLQVVGY